MRYVVGLLAGLIAVSGPAFAAEETGQKVFGSWRLISFQVQFSDENAPTELFGPHPFGRLILTPEHYMMAYLSTPDRKPPTNDTEAAALLRTMVAYTGKFRLEQDKFVTTVDGAWNETYKANEQVRYFVLHGDALKIRSEMPSAFRPGKRASSSLVWEREK
jgi:Lipocalin-like domain